MDIPAVDEAGNGPRRYEVRSEARGADGTLLGCDAFQRDVSPGPAVGAQTALLDLPSCP